MSLQNNAALVYIAGYVTLNDPEMTEDELLGDTSLYFEKHGQYTGSLDRGLLNIPRNNAVQ